MCYECERKVSNAGWPLGLCLHACICMAGQDPAMPSAMHVPCVQARASTTYLSLHGKVRSGGFARSVGKQSHTFMTCSGRLESRAAITVQPIHKPSDSRWLEVERDPWIMSKPTLRPVSPAAGPRSRNRMKATCVTQYDRTPAVTTGSHAFQRSMTSRGRRFRCGQRGIKATSWR